MSGSVPGVQRLPFVCHSPPNATLLHNHANTRNRHTNVIAATQYYCLTEGSWPKPGLRSNTPVNYRLACARQLKARDLQLCSLPSEDWSPAGLAICVSLIALCLLPSGTLRRTRQTKARPLPSSPSEGTARRLEDVSLIATACGASGKPRCTRQTKARHPALFAQERLAI